MCLPPWPGKIFRFTVFSLLENVFVKLFSSLALFDHYSPCKTFHIKPGLIECLKIRSSVFFGISFFVTTNNLINETNSRGFFPWLMSKMEIFLSFSTGRPNLLYDSPLSNSWHYTKNKQQVSSRGLYNLGPSCMWQRTVNRLPPVLNGDSRRKRCSATDRMLNFNF